MIELSPNIQCGVGWPTLTEWSQQVGPDQSLETQTHGEGVENGPHDGEGHDGGDIAEEISAVETKCRVQDDWWQKDVEEEVGIELWNELVFDPTQSEAVVRDGGDGDPEED